MSGGSSAPSGYQPTWQAGADKSMQSLIQGQMPWATSLPGYAIPQFQNLSSGLVNNPYYPGAQAVAGNVGNLATGQVGPAALNAADTMYGMGSQAAPYGAQILQTAFDPQQSLYNRTYQQTMDQQNAINSMYGISGSPYGAGVAGNTASNFNIDWQNNLLNRMATGANAYGNLASGVGSDFTTGMGLGKGGLNIMQEGGLLPYQTYSGNIQQGIGGMQALEGGYSGALQPGMGIAGELGNYMQLGQSATQLAQNAAQINNAASAGMFGGLGSLFGDVFGGGGGSAAGNFLAMAGLPFGF